MHDSRRRPTARLLLVLVSAVLCGCALLSGCAVPHPASVPAQAPRPPPLWLGAAGASPLVLAALEAPLDIRHPPLVEAPALEADHAPPSCSVAPSGEPLGLNREDPTSSGRVVLTFDDGPYPDHTAGVLDTLAAHGMHATFFVLGRHITARSYDLLQRMEAEGHVIGSHSYDHDIRMARHGGDDASVAYIRGQHEVTRVLIELALLARSPADFDALATEVLGLSPDRRLPTKVLESGWPEIVERHQRALAERGYPEGRYPVLYSRPPGGGPYLGRSQAPRARHDAALQQLGMLNVMWHGLSGDVDAIRPRDYHFLTGKINTAARRGGVLLIHDFIRLDALDRALGDIAGDATLEVVGIGEALRGKYGCTAGRLASHLAEPRGGEARSATLGAL